MRFKLKLVKSAGSYRISQENLNYQPSKSRPRQLHDQNNNNNDHNALPSSVYREIDPSVYDEDIAGSSDSSTGSRAISRNSRYKDWKKGEEGTADRRSISSSRISQTSSPSTHGSAVRTRRASSAGEKDLVAASEQLLLASAAAAAAATESETNGLVVAPPASCPLSAIHSLSHNGPIRVENLGTRRQMADKLHERTKGHYCLGSLINPMTKDPKQIHTRSKGEILEQAVDFIEEYFIDKKKNSTEELSKRLIEIKKEIDARGTYRLTTDELLFGAKTAWRNASRCIGRIQWSKLELQDCRNVSTTDQMFEAICKHIKAATNGGNIRSMITVFPQSSIGREDFRIWNPQLFSFAGYQQPDGSVIGDPGRVVFTRVCERLGWKGKAGQYDLLPLVLSAPGQSVKWYDIPEDIVMIIQLEHPKYPWFRELNLQWYALPAVADMCFDVGGLEFPCAPFNGWYMGTEIGSRNLCDDYRYNMAPVIAKKMGLDIDLGNSSLWKDQVLVETNIAVLHSFAKKGVTIVDHHTASETFLTHMSNEVKVRGGCPADWVWIVPPMSSSATGVFHQEMVNYQLKPSFEYQEPAYKSFQWQKVNLKYNFKTIGKLVVSIIRLMKEILSKRIKVTVLYATETGKSEFLTEKLRASLRENFFVEMIKMDEYDFDRLKDERILFMVASTFGNGDPPDNGQSFWKNLNQRMRRMKSTADAGEREQYLLKDLSYAVFGLGSSLYPTFGAFGKNLDKAFSSLGAKRIRPVTIGDELRGQQKLFSVWRQSVVESVVNRYVNGMTEDKGENNEILLGSEVGDKEAFNDDSFNSNHHRLYVTSATRSSHESPVASFGGESLYLEDMLTRIHGDRKYPSLFPMKVVSRIRLLPTKNRFEKQTLLVRLRPVNPLSSSLLSYQPGDHLGIFPSNPGNLVDALIGYLQNKSPEKIVVGSRKELFLGEDHKSSVEPVFVVQSRDSAEDNWVNHPRLPPCTLREALTHYLDINCCPTPRFLSLLANLANDRWDVFRLKKLSQEPEAYKSWRSFTSPNFLDVLNEFPSLHIPPEFILTRLPLLQPRLYSISSSLSAHPGEVHLTLSMARWKSKSGLNKFGVCTNFLDHIPETPVPCFVRQAANFRLPKDLSTPIIMIGAGSGIAPFRSFWQERELQVMNRTGGRRLSLASNSGIGKAILFFGCRSVKVDQLFAEEIDDLLSRGVLHEVFLALSREDGKKKRYVQHEVFKQRTLVYWLLQKEGAHVYVCGDALMADGVRKSLIQMFESEGKMNELQAQDAFDDLRDGSRYHEDIFGILHPA